MKRSIAILLTVCLLCGLVFTLTACGEDAAAPASTQETASTETHETASAAQDAPAAPLPADEKKPVVTEAPVVEDAPEETPDEVPAAPTAMETALTFVDQDASLLAEALGEPLDKQYEASCSGPGDDGIWSYDGLTVFTYRENGVETVVDAE